MIVGPFVLCLAFEMLYRSSLYDASLVDMPKMQKHKKLHNFFVMISEGGEWYVYFIGWAVLFNLVPKASALYLFTASYVQQFV